MILLVAASGKCLTRFSPVFTFKRERERSEVEIATNPYVISDSKIIKLIGSTTGVTKIRGLYAQNSR